MMVNETQPDPQAIRYSFGYNPYISGLLGVPYSCAFPSTMLTFVPAPSVLIMTDII